MQRKKKQPDPRKLRRFDLIPSQALNEVAKVFGYGHEKHRNKRVEDKHYRDPHESVSSALRHINDWLMRDKFDCESHLYHLAHAASQLIIALEMDIPQAISVGRDITEAEVENYWKSHSTTQPHTVIPTMQTTLPKSTIPVPKVDINEPPSLDNCAGGENDQGN